MISDSLFSFLSSDISVKALVGTRTSRADSTTGIFPSQAPDEPQCPYVVFAQSAGDPLSETYEGTGPLLSERWKFTAHGSTYRQAKALARTLLRSLLSFTGPQGTVQVSGAWLRGESDLTEAMAHGTLYSTSVDLDVVYEDSNS